MARRLDNHIWPRGGWFGFWIWFTNMFPGLSVLEMALEQTSWQGGTLCYILWKNLSQKKYLDNVQVCDFVCENWSLLPLESQLQWCNEYCSPVPSFKRNPHQQPRPSSSSPQPSPSSSPSPSSAASSTRSSWKWSDLQSTIPVVSTAWLQPISSTEYIFTSMATFRPKLGVFSSPSMCHDHRQQWTSQSFVIIHDKKPPGLQSTTPVGSTAWLRLTRQARRQTPVPSLRSR